MVNKKDTINISKKNLIIISIILAGVIIGIILYSQNPSIFKQDKIVVTVNEEKIKQSSIDSIQKFALIRGQELTQQQAVEQAIYEELLVQKAESQGYVITKEQAEEKLSFKLSEEGSNLNQLKEDLKKEGSSYEEAIEIYKNQLEMQKYLNETIKLPEINESEAKKFYDKNKEQLGGDKALSYEEMKNQIIGYLTLIEQQKEISKLIGDLRAEANIAYK